MFNKISLQNHSITKLMTRSISSPAFKCKVAIVTGGARGIGLEISKTLLEHGARAVVLADIDEKKGLAAMASLNATFGEDRALFQNVDVGKRNELKGVFDCTKSRFQKIDLVVNNAGTWDDNQWEKTMCTNIFSHVVSTQLAIHHMGKHNCMMGGTVINLMSVFGLGPEDFFFPITFGTNAFGVGYTRAIGDDWYFKNSGVRVMGLLPGITDTRMTRVRRLQDMRGYRDIGDMRMEIAKISLLRAQPVQNVANCLIKMLKIGKSGDIFISEECECYKILPLNIKNLKLITCGKYTPPPPIPTCPPPKPPPPPPKPAPPCPKK